MEINNLNSLDDMKKEFYNVMAEYVNNSVPLHVSSEYFYFLTKSGQLYGYDKKRKLLFEPNDTKKHALFEESFDMYFNDEQRKIAKYGWCKIF